MFTVYVLRSQRNGCLYKGFTSRSLDTRLEEHNNGAANGWTSRNGPFFVAYAEQVPTEAEARDRERFLKSA
ncbi:MAG TPA: GIY-YIG nuclease family protein [Rhodothermia bacterium]|nr:GIY-YIG nuclease family protein [Rhodothermia bacterium]